MSTTSMIVEILIIGIQFATVLLLWAIGLLGHGVVYKPLSIFPGGVSNWIPFVAIVFLSVSYALGIFVDRIAMVAFDICVRPLSKKLPVVSRVMDAVGRETVLMQTLQKENRLGEHLQDLRCRQRIARATVFNIGLACAAFVLTPNLKLLLP